jgi:hypothetical protein
MRLLNGDANATGERLKHHHDHRKELTMTTKTKLALAALIERTPLARMLPSVMGGPR